MLVSRKTKGVKITLPLYRGCGYCGGKLSLQGKLNSLPRKPSLLEYHVQRQRKREVETVPCLRTFRVNAKAAPTRHRQSPNGRINARSPEMGAVMKNDASIPYLRKYGP